MLGENQSEIINEMQDAAGELLNIIFGQAKALLNDNKGYTIQKAIPTVVRGQSLQVHHLTRETAVILPFVTNLGDFHIEVSLETAI
jgi:chemotaxis protein CheX